MAIVVLPVAVGFGELSYSRHGQVCFMLRASCGELPHNPGEHHKMTLPQSLRESQYNT